MPLFVFITGYFSKSVTLKKFLKTLCQFIPIYLLFQSVHLLLNDNMSLIRYVVPEWSLWYIVSLILWRASILIIKSKKIKPLHVILIAILTAPLSGFIPYGSVFSIARVIGFYPFFILGYSCTSQHITKIRNTNKILPWMYICLIFSAIIILREHIDITLIQMKWEYVTVKYCIGTSVALRILFYPVATFLVLSILSVLSNLKMNFTYGNNTLPIYLYHTIIIKVILIYYFIPNNIFTSFLIATCTTLITGSKIMSTINNIFLFEFLTKTRLQDNRG